jgi:glycosyltransferase involved in cell wall biosynthesis
MYNQKSKVAIVYDWIDKWGGVERVLLHMHSLFPNAHFFTSAVNQKNAQWAHDLTVHTSFMQSIPSYIRKQRAFMSILFPLAFESFSFSSYDLVISITSAFAKGIITKPGTKHICYLLTPPRYLWSHTKDYLPGVKGVVAQPFLNHLQKWDICAAHRPDKYISISKTTADRAKQYYQVNSSIVYPPFDTSYWDVQKTKMKRPTMVTTKQKYFLYVGRMESYKKPELIIEAAKQRKTDHFIMVGTGTLERKLKENAPPNCQFAGLISDNELSYLYSNAEALIMPQNEDFGYVSLEAQYHGCPVIAYYAGGASETVIEGVSGLFFEEQTTQSLVSQLERFQQISYNLIHSTKKVRQSILEKFGSKRFDSQFLYQLD